jgi:hypothetical protein
MQSSHYTPGYINNHLSCIIKNVPSKPDIGNVQTTDSKDISPSVQNRIAGRSAVIYHGTARHIPRQVAITYIYQFVTTAHAG